MGLIGWIKKEIESTSRQRRQSAPPPIAVSLASPDQHRDEAYMRAISKFNEWRNNQRFEKLNETKNSSAITQAQNIEHSLMTDDFSMISDVVIEESEKRRLIEMHREKKQQQQQQLAVVKRHEHKAVLYSNAVPRIHRLSLPLMKENSTEKLQRRRSRKCKVHPSSAIDEIEEFEQNHCGQMDADFTVNVASPPRMFYCDNSNPYDAKQMTPEPKAPTPKRQSLMGRNMLRRNKNKGKSPQQPPVVAKAESEASSNYHNGNFKHYEVNSSSVYDEFLKASKAYKENARKQQPEKINSLGESASSGSLSSDPDKNLKNERRLSPPYQTVINKHGDEVEYALPYSERASLSNFPPLPNSLPPDHAKITPSKFEQIINENFQFLNSNLEFFNDELMMDPPMVDAAFEPIDTSFSDIRRKGAQVTDLDKSNDTGLETPAQSADIIKELDALSKWTKNLENCGSKQDVKSPVEEYQAIQRNIKVFRNPDIKFKSGILRNSFATPLDFSNGYFHSTPVTLRSTWPNVYRINSFADVACKREFEILSQTKHQSIAVLMGISHDDDLRVMSLVMEPFDYTLNHYLHQMDQYFTIQQTIEIVQQIASATQYLHECGFIHSNISSHAVLIRDAPFAAKLSSFELTTEILPRESFGKIFHPRNLNSEDKNLLMNFPADSAMAEKYYKLSKQHFVNRTSLPVLKCVENDDDGDSRLPYSVAYRRMFSMHFYQPPELLVPSDDGTYKYVLPRATSDTFALALLLWEALNHCVPFVIFNHDELVHAFQVNDAKLPLLDKSSSAFMEIFDGFLRVNPDERISDVSVFMSMLYEVYSAGDGKKLLKAPKVPTPSHRQKLETKKNFKNAKLSEKVPEKIYFTLKDVDGADPQQRKENAITSEHLLNIGAKDSSRISESVRSSELEAHIASFSQQPGILQDNALDRIRKTVEDQRIIAPKKPTRKLEEAPEVFEASRRSLTDSTMYQSFFDFNRLHTPKIDKDVIYERTSTLKKRLKAPDAREQKRSVKGLFDKQAEAFDKMNNELSQIVQDYDKNDFMNEIVQELTERQKQGGGDENGLSSFLNRGMNLHEQSRSFEELSTAKDSMEPKIKRSGSANVGSSSAYGFAIGDFSLPKTPIARQNKIRRNAWLSDSKKPSGGRISDVDLKPNKSGSDVNFLKLSSDGASPLNRKQYNVSIKIHRNDLDSPTKQKSCNVSQNDSAVNIQLNAPPLVKVNNVELNSSRNSVDINRKYYPMMPEMLVIQNKRDRSGSLPPNDDRFEKSLWHREMGRCQPKQDADENMIVPVRTSVREAVKFIESTFQSPSGTASPVRQRPTQDSFSTPTYMHEETQTEMFFTPSANNPNDDGTECLMQASESIQRLDEIFQTSQTPPILVNKHLENVANPTPKKITTKVTLNLKKISRRASDVGHLKKVQEQSRHSICNNAELIKRIQMHFKNKEPSLQLARKNDAISASCSSLVPKDAKVEVAQSGKCSKYFCRNCGFTMLPVEVLQKIQSGGRFSIASSLAGSLQSIKNDDGSQSMAARRTCHPISETKSTEDLYIDDDFCQGISHSLAANMELMQAPDFFDSLDFNFLSAEIFHEHEFDNTLTDGEKLHLEWHGSDDEEAEDEAADPSNKCDAIEEEPKPNDDGNDKGNYDEPKVDDEKL